MTLLLCVPGLCLRVSALVWGSLLCWPCPPQTISVHLDCCNKTPQSGRFINNTNVFLTIWRLKSKVKASAESVSGESTPGSRCQHTAEMAGDLPRVSYKALIPSTRDPPSWYNPSRGPTSRHCHLGGQVSAYESGGTHSVHGTTLLP